MSAERQADRAKGGPCRSRRQIISIPSQVSLRAFPPGRAIHRPGANPKRSAKKLTITQTVRNKCTVSPPSALPERSVSEGALDQPLERLELAALGVGALGKCHQMRRSEGCDAIEHQSADEVPLRINGEEGPHGSAQGAPISSSGMSSDLQFERHDWGARYMPQGKSRHTMQSGTVTNAR